jgi:hypothetical protein
MGYHPRLIAHEHDDDRDGRTSGPRNTAGAVWGDEEHENFFEKHRLEKDICRCV